MAAMVFACATHAGMAAAADPPASIDQYHALTNKLNLLRRLVEGSPTAKRVRDGGAPAAKAKLAEAEEALESASVALDARRAEAAGALIDEGLRAVSAASRLAGDPRRAARERERYADLEERISSFDEAFRRMVQEKGEGSEALLDRGRVDALRTEARSLAARGDYAGANQRMSKIAEAVEQALSRGRDQETLLHALEFDTPQEAYDYERRRNESYRMLIQLLRARTDAPEAAFSYLEKMLERNEARRREAAEHAERGDIDSAIAVLEGGTEDLARALRSSGLAF